MIIANKILNSIKIEVVNGDFNNEINYDCIGFNMKFYDLN